MTVLSRMRARRAWESLPRELGPDQSRHTATNTQRHKTAATSRSGDADSATGISTTLASGLHAQRAFFQRVNQLLLRPCVINPGPRRARARRGNGSV